MEDIVRVNTSDIRTLCPRCVRGQCERLCADFRADLSYEMRHPAIFPFPNSRRGVVRCWRRQLGHGLRVKTLRSLTLNWHALTASQLPISKITCTKVRSGKNRKCHLPP